MAPNSRSYKNSVEQSITAVLGSPWVWGTVATFVFYGVFPFLPFFPKNTSRYVSAHWVETVSLFLFFVGCCRLLQKTKRILTERGSLQVELLDRLSTDSHVDALVCAARIESHVDQLEPQLADTTLVKRVRDACRFVVSQRSSKDLAGHLKALMDSHRGRIGRGDSLIRSILLMIPILGILGTVMRVSLVLPKITPEKLQTLSVDVTGRLAMSLDCILLSLGLAVLLVFGKQIVEQFEQQILDDVDDLCLNQLPTLFPVEQAVPDSPLRMAEEQAAEKMLVHFERMIHAQLELWQRSLDSLRERWTNTLSHQQESLDESLKAGLTTTLVSHSQHLEGVRSEFLNAFRQTSEVIGQQLAEARTALADQQQQGTEQISQTWQQFRTEITKTRDEHARQLALLIQAVTAEVGGWQNQLASSTQSMSHQFEELRTQGEVFLKISENESQLVRLEGRLAENLESVRVVESLENTLMSLNAAVNLLTSRVKMNAA
jgi:hypothetical protein